MYIPSTQRVFAYYIYFTSYSFDQLLCCSVACPLPHLFIFVRSPFYFIRSSKINLTSYELMKIGSEPIFSHLNHIIYFFKQNQCSGSLLIPWSNLIYSMVNYYYLFMVNFYYAQQSRKLRITHIMKLLIIFITTYTAVDNKLKWIVMYYKTVIFSFYNKHLKQSTYFLI